MGWGVGEALTLISLLSTLAAGAARAGGAIQESQEKDKLSRRQEEIDEHAKRLKDLRERRQRRDEIAQALGTKNIIDVGTPDKPDEYQMEISPGWDIAAGIADIGAATAAGGAQLAGSSGAGAGGTSVGQSGRSGTTSSYTQPAETGVDLNTPGIGTNQRMASNRYDPYKIYGGGPLYG